MPDYVHSVLRLRRSAKKAGVDMDTWSPAFAQLESLADRLLSDVDDTSLAREFRQTYQPVVAAVEEAKKQDTSLKDIKAALWGALGDSKAD